jgi:hypothetical protein
VAVVLGACSVSWGQKKASAPSPVDGATDVIVALFQWKAGSTALFHNVYLGVTPNLGPEQLIAKDLYFTIMVYYHQPGIVPGTTYYWRVDEIDKDGVTVHTGDVWSFTAWPFTAFLPDPQDGSNTAAVAPTLKWLKGRGALKHHVYLGDSKAAVADGAAEADKGLVTEPNYAPGELQPATTYFWRVDEIGVDGTPVVGNVWSFTTILPVDDFESYTNDVGSRLFQTWVDGWGYSEPAPGNPGNGTGASVGHDIWMAGTPYTTIVETKIIHGGKQSMPLDYNNVGAPFYSEADRTWTSSQDWTANDVNMLTLHVQGRPRDIDILSVTTPPVIDGKIDDIWSIASVQIISRRINEEDPTGPEDASGQFRVLCDAQNLYALVEIKDATLINDSANSWQDDSVEFYVDGDNTKKGAGLDGNNRQYTFGWTTTDVQGTNTALDGVVHAQTNVPGGWQIEIKFPWQSLLGSSAPIGKLIGIDSFYNDDDNGADTRESQIAWHSTAGGDWETPASWGTALVVPASAGGTDRLYVTLRDAANHTGTVAYPQADILMAKQWFEWPIPLSDFAAAGVNLSTVRKMSIGVGDRANPAAGGSGPLFIDDIYLTRPAPKE